MDLNYITSVVGDIPFEKLSAAQAKNKQQVINIVLVLAGVALIGTTWYFVHQHYSKKIQELQSNLDNARSNNFKYYRPH